MLKKIRQGEASSINTLLKRYRPYCHALASTMLDEIDNNEILEDDLFSVAFSAVAIAISHYNIEKYTSSFYAYWMKIATNDIKHYVKNMKIGISRVSLDTDLPDGRNLHDIVGSNDEFYKGDSLYNQFIQIIENHDNSLSDKERILVRYYLDGFEFKEIATLMNCSKSQAYYLFQTAVQKIRIIITGSK